MDLIIEHTQTGLRDTFRLMGAMMMLGGIGLMLVIARFRRIARRDIRQQRALEEKTRLWQQELAHVSRVSTMGELTASLAHDLSQPLTALSPMLRPSSGCFTAPARTDRKWKKH